MTSLHVDLNKAAKCVDIKPLTLLAYLVEAARTPSHTCTKCKMATIFGITYKDSSTKFMKVGGIKTWKELATGVQQLIRLLFNNNFINPGLVL